MNIEYVQIKYDVKNIEKIFPSTMEENSRLISLDSRSFLQDTDEKNKIVDYLKRIVLTGGTSYNWIISLTGKIYHITPDNKSAKNSLFEFFSERISKELPDYCPQFKIDTNNPDKYPDDVITSICLEEDPNDVTKVPSGDQRDSFINLLAYFIKNNNITASKLINRNEIPKLQHVKDGIGEKAYKADITSLVVASTYSYLLTKKESEIVLVKTSDLEISK